MAVAVVLLQALSCLGLGTAILRLLRVEGELGPAELAAFAFAIGLGLIGWLVFLLGVTERLTTVWLSALLVSGCLGLVLYPIHRLRARAWAPGPVGWTLLALLALTLSWDVMEALAPPTDADTLAYHYTLAKRFIAEHRIEFVPRAVDGAVPLLVQMTFMPVLALGGEVALGLWAMSSGWAAGALLFLICRRYLSLYWSLAITLVFLTMPAVVYGAGTGQVEVRLALFTIVAAWAAGRALETGALRHAALAGLAAGFYMGAKYTGLLFVVAAGLVILAQRRWLAHGTLYAVAAIAAGAEWYWWNWLHTGDPVFPMGFPWLGVSDPWIWNESHHAVFREVHAAVERLLPRDPLNMVLYPFIATLQSPAKLESGRTGFGPFALSVLPLAAVGVWRFRRRIRPGPLLSFAAVTAIFYVLWFVTGPSQRVRHLLPVMPLLLACFAVASVRAAEAMSIRGPLVLAVAVTLCLQVAGQALFGLNHVRFLLGGEDRETYLGRNVSSYEPVSWINANLTPGDRILTFKRGSLYFLRVPYYYAHPVFQALVETMPELARPEAAVRQMSRLDITHVLLPPAPGERSRGTGYPPPFDALEAAGCLEFIRRFQSVGIASRTLPTLARSLRPIDVLRFRASPCNP